MSNTTNCPFFLSLYLSVFILSIAHTRVSYFPFSKFPFSTHLWVISWVEGNTNPSMKPAGIKAKRTKNSKNERNPNWLDLTEDVWFLILSKLTTIDIIVNVQKVCMLFRKLCKHPSMFKKIRMEPPHSSKCSPYDIDSMSRYAIDCSAGQLVDISLDNDCDERTLVYIAER